MVEIFDKLRVPMSQYLRRLGLSQEDSEEIVQETFLRLFKRLRDKGQGGNPHGWAFRVAHNLAIDRYKDQLRCATKSPQEWAGLSDLLMDQSPNPEESMMSREEVARINQAISSLSSRQLQCVYLRAEGFRHREIAKLLGVTMATVAESLRRATRKLRADEM
ncbi:MAG TPA: RNA polymerase sigma factor [Blastocatellia bacterium]|nr:RNA polymerase sigma factor [Blastocatellia bacterium]